ncbi:biotin--protein ligase 2-like isoform X2 [Carex littledalei]|uniref:Biotin--protein ligase 2-like isoform X2 n=1 Tax=Carex littledalei TaxID=544730 RepID=A0A833QUT2_9POAL|nr:biotin--protein ligase 2-like isoform X2 [Carex littledalei]
MPFLVRIHPFAVAVAAATVAAIIHLRRRHSHIKAMGPTLLVLSAKSHEELKLAQSLKLKLETSASLNLSEEEKEVKVLLDSEVGPTDKLNFEVGSYMGSLVASRFGRLLIWSPRLSSTHDLVSKNFHELPCGTVCISDVQFKGRGRSKNVWDSPLGCLLFSFTLQIEDGKKLPLLQYVVSLAVTEAIKQLCRDKGLPQLDLRIKWPNDLYLEGLKVGGILCTSSYQSKFFHVSAGVGLNVDNQKPTTCLNTVLGKKRPNLSKLTREEILASFFNKFEDLFEIFLKEGFNVLEDIYCKTWLHSGQKVVIEEKIDGRSIQAEVTIQGLTLSGYLLATDKQNNFFELHPDGNRLKVFYRCVLTFSLLLLSIAALTSSKDLHSRCELFSNTFRILPSYSLKI